jgi:uncharacterized Zn-binding protein involved in type VI secretion
MTQRLICIGDSHSHGGKVVSSTTPGFVDGLAVACVGDNATCHIHGNVTIVDNDGTMYFLGRKAAREGDKLSCGASLIASQSLVGN